MQYSPPRPARLFIKLLIAAVFIMAQGSASGLHAAIIGTNPPTPPLTVERIATLPASVQPAWKNYLINSVRQRQADQNFFQQELKRNGLLQSSVPPTSHSSAGMPLSNAAAWYGGEEARRIADNVVSFQTPAGGWSKNLDLSQHPRAAGELFGPENGSQFLGRADFDTTQSGSWSYVGTIDNAATTTELLFLAKVIAAVGNKNGGSYHKSFLRGVDYLIAAQFPNGGWPQVWPLQGGYHDAITFNDGAMLNVLELLGRVSEAKDEFVFVPVKYRKQAAASFKQGMECLLAAQVVVDKRRTIWSQQYDALTLQPTSARNYEMPSLSSGESAGIMLFLMQRPEPAKPEVAAVHAAAAWFGKTKLMDVAFKFTGNNGRHLIAAPGNGPIWARYYGIGDDQPLFGDRDKTIHDNVEDISPERRKGYAWFTDTARRALSHYARWSKTHPQEN